LPTRDTVEIADELETHHFDRHAPSHNGKDLDLAAKCWLPRRDLASNPDANRKVDTAHMMIRIAITQAAFDATAKTLPLGSVALDGHEQEGEGVIFLD
jgi:hypothetical protein